jgi:dipeptidyl aminopeptidase/acylaminoacyl peptidase
MKSLFTLILAAIVAGGAMAAETHPFSVHDMLAMERISEPRVSPDGKWVAFTLRTTDLEANAGKTDLWRVRTDAWEQEGKESQPVRLTSHAASDTSPRWSPDSKSLFFLSSRSGSNQVWKVRLEGGEEQVTNLPLDVGSLAVSPDGSHLLVAIEVFPDANAPEATRKRLDEIAKRKGTGRVYDRAFVRHWDAWKDGRRSHLFVLPSTGKGKPIDVMGTMDADCPSKPFGGPEEFTFTPDGREVVFTARNAGREEPWSTNFDLYRAPIDGSKPPECLTKDNPAWDTSPTFSPDGKTLAYLAMARPGYEADRYRIVLQPWPKGPKRVLTEAWDRSPSEICWSSDGQSILATAADVGQTMLFDIKISSGKVSILGCRGHVTSPTAAGDSIVFCLDDLKSPAELHCMQPIGGNWLPLTQINAERLAAARMGDFEQFTFKGHGGDTVYAYLVKPVDFDPSKKYPVAFLIHGGPQGSFGNDFHYRWNPQAYAGAGYAAVMIDFHGSTGYGQAFCDSIREDWGGGPLEDLQKGLDAALAKYPWLDGDRVAALGASYGGYMVNWIAGKWPDRFRCLVSHDGILDERMAYYETDELWFPEWEHHGTPWARPASYEKFNPVLYVDRWKTPMLVIHGALDYRIPDTQGIAVFQALQRKGVPSRLLHFADENHWVLKPRNSIQWHETVLEWLDRWVKK